MPGKADKMTCLIQPKKIYAYIYVYVHMYMCMYICVYVYISM